MIRVLPLLLLLSFAATAAAPPVAERVVQIGSFERLRVDGPIVVMVATGSPRATVDGDPRVVDLLTVRLEGRTLVVRMGRDGRAEQGSTERASPIRVTLSTPALASLAISGGAEARATRMKADRVDLSVTGTGAITVADAQATQVNATVIGTGSITVAGRTNTARLLDNGPGTIDAAALEVSELVVRVDGPGTVRARARYTAQLSNLGTGSISVAGTPRCVVQPGGGGTVTCGDR